ncbi:MAG: phosphoglycerate kinase, partial [Nanoarchaeota archaeon]
MIVKTLRNFDFKDKLVLLRTDINSPVVNGKIIDSPRIEWAAKTIRYLLSNNAKVVIIAHQGRKGGKDFIVSLKQHAKLLSKYIGNKVEYVDGLFEEKAIVKIDELESGEAILMKNVRYYEDE